jgi:hypothetical protein
VHRRVGNERHADQAGRLSARTLVACGALGCSQCLQQRQGDIAGGRAVASSHPVGHGPTATRFRPVAPRRANRPATAIGAAAVAAVAAIAAIRLLLLLQSAGSPTRRRCDSIGLRDERHVDRWSCSRSLKYDGRLPSALFMAAASSSGFVIMKSTWSTQQGLQPPRRFARIGPKGCRRLLSSSPLPGRRCDGGPAAALAQP